MALHRKHFLGTVAALAAEWCEGEPPIPDFVAGVEVFVNPRLRRAAGRCLFVRVSTGWDLSHIEIHPAVAKAPADRGETLLHEVAHAAAGAAAGHGYAWKVYARLLGAEPSACSDIPSVRESLPVRAKCWGCGWKWHKTRALKRSATRYRCPSCGGALAPV